MSLFLAGVMDAAHENSGSVARRLPFIAGIFAAGDVPQFDSAFFLSNSADRLGAVSGEWKIFFQKCTKNFTLAREDPESFTMDAHEG